MPTSDIIINLSHLLAFGIANAVFASAVLYRLKLVSKGRAVDNLAPMESRIRSVLFNVLFQQKLYKHPMRGMMHAFIFYGFIVYQMHTMSQMIVGNAWALFDKPGAYEFNITEYIYLGLDLSAGAALGIVTLMIALIGITFLIYNSMGGARKGAGFQWLIAGIMLGELTLALAMVWGSGKENYEFILQHFSLLVLTGLGYFAYRRWIRRSGELDIPSSASFIVISMIGTLMVSTLVAGSSQVYLNDGLHGNWITGMINSILGALGMNDKSTATAVRDFSWWAHIATVYSFMVYVPTSKHGHLIFAPMNFFMIRDQPKGAIPFMDLEDEAGVWGVGNVSEHRWTSLLDGLSCIECGRCTVQCPANRTGKLLNPKRIITEMKHAMLDHGNTLLTHNPEEGHAPTPMVSDTNYSDSWITDEEIMGCTTCYACVEACPVGNNQVEAIMEMRRYLIQVESRLPQELQLAFQNMENNSNPWGIGAHTRAEWCEDLGVKTMAEDKDVDILYWVGCAGSFDERNKQIARSLVKVMQKADVKFGILGTEEQCTGDSARRGGNEYLYQTLAQANIEMMNNYGVKKIVTACPHCYNTIKNEYPQMGGNYDVVHHSEFVEELVADGKIEMDPAVVEEMKGKRSVYHDSCYLGRYNDVYEEPRNLVKNALGMDLSEAEDHHSTSLCCGAGGAQMWMEEEYERVNVKRTGQLVDTGADTIATACPFCITMMTDGIKELELQDSVKVLDIVELVEAGMKGGSGAVKGGFATTGAKH